MVLFSDSSIFKAHANDREHSSASADAHSLRSKQGERNLSSKQAHDYTRTKMSFDYNLHAQP